MPVHGGTLLHDEKHLRGPSRLVVGFLLGLDFANVLVSDRGDDWTYSGSISSNIAPVDIIINFFVPTERHKYSSIVSIEDSS